MAMLAGRAQQMFLRDRRNERSRLRAVAAEIVIAGLSGTDLVADDLFLTMRDDLPGRTFLQPRPIGLRQAGMLLAELIMPAG